MATCLVFGPGSDMDSACIGPWSPDEGLRCNPSKLLLDPYARAIVGNVVHEPAIFAHVIASDGAATSEANTEDSAPFVPRAVVVDPKERWQRQDAPPRHPLHRSVIYELHVKGFTALATTAAGDCAARMPASHIRRSSGICSSSASPPSS